MNYLFIIQAEGKGHLSQAIALSEILEESGHHIEKVLAGKSFNRSLPEYAKHHFEGKLHRFYSPNFIRTRDKKGIRTGLSILINLFLSPLYLYSIFKLEREIKQKNIDVIINFYDMLGGFANFFSFSRKEFIVVSHHYYLTSRYFNLPSGHFWMKNLLYLHNWLCALKATEKWALSFREFPSDQGLKLKPPLLRRKLFDLKPIIKEFILVYLLNEGLVKDIIELSYHMPEFEFRVYTSHYKRFAHDNRLIFFQINELAFLKDLSECRALITTAGFETQCEAAYLGKPVFTIPGRNHFEQICNALDGEESGISKGISDFSIENIRLEIKQDLFREWCLSWKK